MSQQQLRQTRIFAHRGSCESAVENTMAAFEAAVAQQVDGIETDVQLTADEIAVLWHDRGLGKLGLPDQYIEDLTYPQLQEIDFSGHLSHSPAVSDGIMSLSAFVKSFHSRCQLLIEVKNRAHEPVCRHQQKMEMVVALLRDYPQAEVWVSSFNLQSLIDVHQLAPEFRYVYNLKHNQGLDVLQRVMHQQPFLSGFCLHISQLNRQTARQVQQAERWLMAYTCNTTEQINTALQLGIDVLITDYPAKAMAMRAHET